MTTQELRDEVYTSVDFIRTASVALTERNVETLENLKSLSRDWLQSEDETEAQIELLDSMIEVLGEVDDFEEYESFDGYND